MPLYRGRVAVLAILLSFLATYIAGAHSSLLAAPDSSPDPRSAFGVAGAMRWGDWGTFDKPAAAMVETGGSWVREDFVWGLIEPKENVFSWTATDRIVAALNSKRLNTLGIISYAANWATPAKEDDGAASAVSFYPPDGSKYYWFVRALVDRYKGSVHYWEVWNEPNNGQFWKPQPDPHQYATLLMTAYKAVKDADPTAKVLSAGMSGNSVPFLEQVTAAGAGNSFDILALHPYAVPLDPAQGKIESRPDVHRIVEVELLKYRAFLQRHGMNKPIWITEISWPAGDWGLDEQTQANYLAQAYAQILASGLVDKVFWYSAKDESSSPQQSWGLTAWGKGSADLTARRPAFAAYATSAHTLAGLTPLGTYVLGNTQTAAGFEGSGGWGANSGRGTLVFASDQAHSGSGSGKIQYRFDSANQAVDFAPPSPIELPGKPSQIALWVRGDGSGDYLSVWIKDRDGELFKVRLGAVTGAADGWRQYTAHLNTYYFGWERAGSNQNGVVDYPVSVAAFRLENTPDEPAGGGTIYVDDLTSTQGDDAFVSRFGRTDGQVVDVVWAASDTVAHIPTRSTTASIVDRDGAARTVQSSGGMLQVQAGSRPVYLIHKPAEAQAGQVYSDSVESNKVAAKGSQACSAALAAAQLTGGGSLYFPETHHNLGGDFLAYWQQHGSIKVLGFPITEEFQDTSTDGKTYRQQYFQRARLEYHPENAAPNNVLLGLLGVWTTTGRNFAKTPQQTGAALFFAQTGHNVNLFKDWWQRSGSISVFGLPISDEMQERNAADAKMYTVQYFERNRLEYHPEYKGTDAEVMLGLLGVEYLQKQGCK